jgi:hypothetical protein
MSLPIGPRANASNEYVKSFRVFLASEALAKGDVVKLETVASTGETLGKSVVKSSAASLLTVGVVAKAAADGDPVLVQTYGFCDFITTDGNVTDGAGLQPGASGVAVPYADAASTVHGSFFGVALDADSSTTLTSAWLFRGC